MTPIDHLQAMLRIPTVSRPDMLEEDWAPFDDFLELLPRLFPALFAVAEVTPLGHTLLLRWPGIAPGPAHAVIAHYDVVPAGGEAWTHGPFSGEVAAGQVWGRGAIDDKGRLAAVLEAVEELAARGHVPRVDLYLAVDHDEETAGSGARAVAAELARRSVRLAAVFDEGEGIISGAFPGISKPTAMIGVAEKGFVNVILTVVERSGHSSVPPRFPATVRLARAVTRVDARAPRPLVTPAVAATLRVLAAHATEPRSRRLYRRALRLPRLAAGRLATEAAELAPLLQTTQVVTQLSGSAAHNTLAERATATVNARILPGENVAALVERITRAVGDTQVIITTELASEPSGVSATAGPAWGALIAALGAAEPEAIPVPFVLPGATDSRHLAAVAETVYRFAPMMITTAQRPGLHGSDERIDVDAWQRSVRFYTELLSRL